MKGGGNVCVDGDGVVEEAGDRRWEGVGGGSVMGELDLDVKGEEGDWFYVNRVGFDIGMGAGGSVFMGGGV
ncbi:hypothetical protein [Bacillus pumilus]|uniref:hypothetical protein n=1 Tax=Bacillus pumilus TaxID=1408 RepID=UPI0011AA0444|nr:hypothetical protein [Bacillus pumilus]